MVLLRIKKFQHLMHSWKILPKILYGLKNIKIETIPGDPYIGFAILD